jgi:hypothetical protein
MKVRAVIGGDQTIDMDAVLLDQLTYEKSIASWSGPGFAGRPVNAANIGELPPWILEKLKDAINGLRKNLEESEKKALTDTTN